MARLIDADALKKEIVDFKRNLRPHNQEYGIGYFSALSVVEGMLVYVPTVDAVEVVHGRWVLHEDGSGTCTNCRRRTKGCWDYDSFYRHCPNCCAQMDLEVKDG